MYEEKRKRLKLLKSEFKGHYYLPYKIKIITNECYVTPFVIVPQFLDIVTIFVLFCFALLCFFPMIFIFAFQLGTFLLTYLLPDS
jgi:uncharacterized membrane protein